MFLDSVIDKHFSVEKNNVEHICVLGDMNTDYSRAHSWHTQALNRFIDHENLYVALQHSSSNVPYSYSNSYSQCYSILDHIFLSESLPHYNSILL